MVKHADPWPGPESPTRIAGSAGPLARAGHVFSRACHVSRGNHAGGDSLLMFTVYCISGLLYSMYICIYAHIVVVVYFDIYIYIHNMIQYNII